MAISYFGTGMGRGVLRHTAIFLVLGFSLDAGVSETVAGCAFIQRVFFFLLPMGLKEVVIIAMLLASASLCSRPTSFFMTYSLK